MKNRTRLFLVVAVGILVLGLGTGLLASYVGGLQNFAIVGQDGPDELAYVPADAQMVAYADVRSLSNSQLRQQIREIEPNAGSPEELEKATGINIERDVLHVVAAAWRSGGETAQDRPLLLARGTFNEVQIESLVAQHGGTASDYKGKRFLEAPDAQGGAVAFLEPGLVAVGSAAAVRRAIDTKAANGGTIRTNTQVMSLIREIDGGNAWAVAKLDAMAGRGVPPQVASQLPPIDWVTFSGHVTDGIEATVRAETRDDASAQNLREVIRGFIALGRLQSGQRPEFEALVNSVELGGQGKTVSLSFSVPAQVIQALHSIRRQAPERLQQPRSAPAL